MCFFVGNDFLPCIPHLDIADGSLNLMMNVYRDLMPQMRGYLSDKAAIHMPRLELFLQEIARYDPRDQSIHPSILTLLIMFTSYFFCGPLVVRSFVRSAGARLFIFNSELSTKKTLSTQATAIRSTITCRNLVSITKTINQPCSVS